MWKCFECHRRPLVAAASLCSCVTLCLCIGSTRSPCLWLHALTGRAGVGCASLHLRHTCQALATG